MSLESWTREKMFMIGVWLDRETDAPPYSVSEHDRLNRGIGEVIMSPRTVQQFGVNIEYAKIRSEAEPRK